MLTKNFYNHAMSIMTNTTVTGGYTDYKNNKINTYPYATAFIFSVIQDLGTTISDSTYGVTVGGGTTPPTGEDYNLENPITTGISIVKPGSGALSRESDGLKWSATYAIVNNTASPVTINEIGLFSKGNSTQSTAIRVLFDRTVLEAPVVIEPGQCKQLTYTIMFKYPA